jgi:hypothetical protein
MADSKQMPRAHVIKLYPNRKQDNFFVRSCGVARFAYNWGLNEELSIVNTYKT